MKKKILVVALLLFSSRSAQACVLRMLTVGIIDSTEGHLIAEVIAITINERTGTRVDKKFFATSAELYEAMSTKKVDIIVENTTEALRLLGHKPEADLERTYDTVKSRYEEKKQLIWLKPFGFTDAGKDAGLSHTAPVIRLDVLNSFPALPRVLNKLGGMINDKTFSRLMKSVQAGEKPGKVARKFLDENRLI